MRIWKDWLSLSKLLRINYWIWLSYCWLSNNLGPLNWLIFNVGFNLFLRDIFYFFFVSILRHIFCNMFNLLIVGISFGYRLVVCLINRLIFCDSSGNWNIFSNLLRNIFSNLSFNRDLGLHSNRLIINIGSLNRNMLNIWGIFGRFSWINDDSLNLGISHLLIKLILGLNRLLNVNNLLTLLIWNIAVGQRLSLDNTLLENLVGLWLHDLR